MQEGYIEPSRPIKNLLIVAGVSGAGKNVFLRQLRAGKLPEKIVSQLPSGRRDWPNVKKDDFSGQKDLNRWNRKTPGLVLHFNLTSALSAKKEFKLPKSRRRFMRLLHFAQCITVVTIKPSAEQLIQHVKNSKLGGRGYGT